VRVRPGTCESTEGPVVPIVVVSIPMSIYVVFSISVLFSLYAVVSLCRIIIKNVVRDVTRGDRSRGSFAKTNPVEPLQVPGANPKRLRAQSQTNKDTSEFCGQNSKSVPLDRMTGKADITDSKTETAAKFLSLLSPKHFLKRRSDIYASA